MKKGEKGQAAKDKWCGKWWQKRIGKGQVSWSLDIFESHYTYITYIYLMHFLVYIYINNITEYIYGYQSPKEAGKSRKHG